MSLKDFFHSLLTKKTRVEETVIDKLPGNPDEKEEGLM